ncbi:MAG: hypothetical protein GVY16_03925 [Planctomycetes bacterium]|nr:hypothetical protein [Planctomycetota bacterium]
MNMLEPLIRQARNRAMAGMVLAGALCVLEVMSMVLVVMRWRVDQALGADGALPARSMVTLLAPPVLTLLLLLLGAWALWHWSRWHGLRTERQILETLADTRDNEQDAPPGQGDPAHRPVQ